MSAAPFAVVVDLPNAQLGKVYRPAPMGPHRAPRRRANGRYDMLAQLSPFAPDCEGLDANHKGRVCIVWNAEPRQALGTLLARLQRPASLVEAVDLKASGEVALMAAIPRLQPDGSTTPDHLLPGKTMPVAFIAGMDAATINAALKAMAGRAA
jgi:hypothetical protein